MKRDEALLFLLEQSRNGPLSVKQILEALSDKSSEILLLFLSLPFCTPLQIPGLSIPFGLVIIVMGLRIGIMDRVLLPKAVLAKTISPRLMNTMVTKSVWLLQKCDRLVQPRLSWICRFPPLRACHGMIICLSGLYFVLPVPIPFSNIPPAWVIFLISLGLLEEDGLLVCAGYLIAAFGLGALLYLGLSLCQ